VIAIVRNGGHRPQLIIANLQITVLLVTMVCLPAVKAQVTSPVAMLVTRVMKNFRQPGYLLPPERLIIHRSSEPVSVATTMLSPLANRAITQTPRIIVPHAIRQHPMAGYPLFLHWTIMKFLTHVSVAITVA